MSTDSALEPATRLIANFESFRSEVYWDGGGVCTQGYGCCYHPDGSRVRAVEPPVTEPQAMAWLQGMVASVLLKVRGMVQVTISTDQAVSLTSFAYNVGTAALRDSTLLKLLNGGEFVEAGKQFGAWVHDRHGFVEPGLVTRRAAEAAPFLAVKPPALSVADRLNQIELDRIRT